MSVCGEMDALVVSDALLWYGVSLLTEVELSSSSDQLSSTWYMHGSSLKLERVRVIRCLVSSDQLEVPMLTTFDMRGVSLSAEVERRGCLVTQHMRRRAPEVRDLSLQLRR